MRHLSVPVKRGNGVSRRGFIVLAALLLAIPAMVLCISDDDMQAISALNQNLRSNALNDPETFPW